MLVVLVLLFILIVNGGFALRPSSNIGSIFYDTLRAPLSESFMTAKARRLGYTIEEHNVRTEDGYILKIFQLPASSSAKCKMPVPVYIHHGLTESSDFWVLSGPQRALSFVLANAGYDVWLGNARGNIYSRKHESLAINSTKFWQFSYHEIAMYDNPAVIEYILSKTNQKQLHYIGHSQGATTFFITTSMKPEYNEKVKTMHGLAPVVYMKSQISPFFTLMSNHSKQLLRLAKHFGFAEYLPNLWIFRLLANLACVEPTTNEICYSVFRLIGGQSPLQKDNDVFPQAFSIFPAGSSVYQMLHYTQCIQKGGFKWFDYGEKKNRKKYGTPDPPDYPLENVVASSIFLYVSGGDFLCQLPDVDRLIARLPKKPVKIEIADKQFGHFDYAFGKYAKELVYDRIIKEMENADKVSCRP